jgi:hypothetical protein
LFHGAGVDSDLALKQVAMKPCPSSCRWLSTLLRGGEAGTRLALLTVSSLLTVCSAVTFQESFSTDPAANGWQVHGDGTLFSWDSTNETLRVTWDSSRTNSYFHLPLNHVLTRTEDFAAAFDLRVDDINAGTTSGKPFTFQIAVCLFDIDAARRTNFFIGSGTSPSSGPRSTIEFNYFPPSQGVSATFSAIAVPTNTNPFLFNHDFPRELDAGVWHRISLVYRSTNETVTMTKQRAGVPYGTVQTIPLTGTFDDFAINTFAITSYSDRAGTGSVLAHGVIDNVEITLPSPPIESITLALTNGSQAAVHFESSAGWNYMLERSSTFTNWSPASAECAGSGGMMTLIDTTPPMSRAFYRIRAQQP